MKQVERVRNLEAELAEARREAARALRECRESLDLSLRDVGNSVRLSAAAIYNIETNKSWRTKTAAKIARSYERAA